MMALARRPPSGPLAWRTKTAIRAILPPHPIGEFLANINASRRRYAMKEDILEQLVEDYFQRKGYFTRHNVKFRPKETHRDYAKKEDCVHSDIDVLGYNPHKRGPSRVVAVTCKSWQGGFSPKRLVELKGTPKTPKLAGRPMWKHFRELMVDKWSESFKDEIEKTTNSTEFTYYLAVTKLQGDQEQAVEAWENCARFKKALNGNPLEIITVENILAELWQDKRTAIAESEVGRLLQVVKASGWNPVSEK